MNKSALKCEQASAKNYHDGEKIKQHQLLVFQYKKFLSNASTAKESRLTSLCKKSCLSNIWDQKEFDESNVSG